MMGTRQAKDIALLIPPDPHGLSEASEDHSQRLPPQGPAVVAAVLGEMGQPVVPLDLARELDLRPLARDGIDGAEEAGAWSLLRDDARVEAHVRGASDPHIERVVAALIARLEALLLRAGSSFDRLRAVAISVERHSQLPFVSLLARAIKRRAGCAIAVGGQNPRLLVAYFTRAGSQGGSPGGARLETSPVDIASRARTPDELRRVFSALLEIPSGREGAAVDPLVDDQAIPSEGWPLPDYGIYDLDAYRYAADARGKEPAPSGTLVLPYTPAFGCQFACAFCQDRMQQVPKPPHKIVEDLAALVERWGVRDFAFMSSQINVQARELSGAIQRAGLGIHWSDSYRVHPSPEGTIGEMAAAGCVGLTFGVESAAPAVLRRMRKGHRAEQATRVLREAHEAEIMTRVNLLPGFPGETRADFEQTVSWLSENAERIDDMAPSSFYLDADSPIGREPERFGLKMRGERELGGEHRYRKSVRSRTYDEIDGMSWEEREATLFASEDRLREVWSRARGARRLAGGLSVVRMLLLRRQASTKAAIYADMIRADAARPQRAPAGERATGAAADPWRARASTLATALPPGLRPGATLERFEGGLLFAFLDPDGARHCLEISLAGAPDSARTPFERSGGLDYAYRALEPSREGAASTDVSAFLGSYRRLIRALGPYEEGLEGWIAEGADLPDPSAAGELPEQRRDLATPHIREGALVEAALEAARESSGSLEAWLDARLPVGIPLRCFLYLENPCQLNCEFCGLPGARPGEGTDGPGGTLRHGIRFPRGRDLIDSGALAGLLRFLRHSRPLAELCVTGNDWAVHPRLADILSALEEGEGPALSLYGPSLAVADAGLFERVVALPGLRELRLSLHSEDSLVHDKVTGAPGSGERLRGLIARLGAEAPHVRLRINAVLTRRVVRALPSYLAWLAKGGHRVSLLAYIPDRPDPEGPAGPQAPAPSELMLPWAQVRRALAEAGPSAAQALEALIGLPVCAVPPELREHLSTHWNSAEAGAMRFPLPCEACRWRPSCMGVTASYEDRWGGEGLSPELVSP